MQMQIKLEKYSKYCQIPIKTDVINTHIKCRDSNAEAWLLGLLSSVEKVANRYL